MNSTPVKGVLERRFESAFQNADSAFANKHEVAGHRSQLQHIKI